MAYVIRPNLIVHGEIRVIELNIINLEDGEEGGTNVRIQF